MNRRMVKHRRMDQVATPLDLRGVTGVDRLLFPGECGMVHRRSGRVSEDWEGLAVIGRRERERCCLGAVGLRAGHHLIAWVGRPPLE